jgi:predicted amidophosphoribosyltransferase
VYEGAVVRAIVLLKFEQIEPPGAWFAERLAELVKAEAEALAAGVVVPVPLHRERERERGYNQGRFSPNHWRKGCDCPIKRCCWEERWESVRGAFATRPGSRVDNLRVLLVDDVLTTGVTLDACARALRDAGAKSVIGLTVARAIRNPLPSTRE